LQRVEESREPLFFWRAAFASRLPLVGTIRLKVPRYTLLEAKIS